MLMSKGSMGIFFANTLVTTLVLIGIVLLVLPLIMGLMGRRARKAVPVE
jgi:putative tricarboxylic transport membrane protein